MTTLQEYLNNKYPNNQEQVTKITTSETTELLEGGELDLSAFTNLKDLEIDLQFLTTPLTKIITNGLASFKEVIFKPDQETPEEKKLFEDLGIAKDIQQKKAVKELKKLSELFATAELSGKKINLHFATAKLPQTKLAGKEIISEDNNGEQDIYLNLEGKDNKGNFSPNLLFWTLIQELTAIKLASPDKNPTFWSSFFTNLEWVKQNITQNYQKDWELLLNPSIFPHEELNMGELLSVYFPISDSQGLENSQITVKSEIIDKTWKTTREELMKLLEKELSNNPPTDKLAELALVLTVENSNQKYIIQVHYHANIPFKNELEKLISTTPLKSEVERLEEYSQTLKQEQTKLPTPEEIEKITKQKQILTDCLRDSLNPDEYQKVIDQINQIK